MIRKKGGGKAASNKKWKFGMNEIKVIKSYKYLGVSLSVSWNFSYYLKSKITTTKFANYQ